MKPCLLLCLTLAVCSASQLKLNAANGGTAVISFESGILTVPQHCRADTCSINALAIKELQVLASSQAAALAAQQQAAAAQQTQGGMPQELTAENLAAAAPAMQKQMLGERLYPKIVAQEPGMLIEMDNVAGKITGMLLEMDNAELLLLLQEPASLNEKIAEAMKVLEEHQRQQDAQ